MDSYLSYLMSHPDEIDQLISAVTIKFSSFFRNTLVFELLHTLILPELVREYNALRVLCIGCAKGQEPYSIAILIRDMLDRERFSFDYEIIGVDLDQLAIQQAVAGEYLPEEVEEVKKRQLDHYFDAVPNPQEKLLGAGDHNLYRLRPEIIDMVRFSVGDVNKFLLQRRTAFTPFHLILCRNLLIYMGQQRQEELLTAMTEMLTDDGYLVLGQSESLTDSVRNRYSQPFVTSKIFRKQARIGALPQRTRI